MLKKKTCKKLNIQIKISKLTPRQIQVVGLVAYGHSNAEIADILAITEATVKKHIKDIYRCFNFNDNNYNSSTNRVKLALIWLKYKDKILELKKDDVLKITL